MPPSSTADFNLLREPPSSFFVLWQVAELAALESLASPSSVEKEKAQLAMMKAALQESLGKVGTIFLRNVCWGGMPCARCD